MERKNDDEWAERERDQTIIIIIIDLISPLLQMSKDDTIYRFYTKYSLPAQHAG